MNLEEIKKLALLSRIEMNEGEMEEIAKDLGPILDYVGQVKEASGLIDEKFENKKPENYFLHNVIREDVVTNKRVEYTEKVLEEMPDKQDGYLKVKQIL